MDYENEIIELTGEDGDSIKCEYLDTVLMNDNEYVVLLPVDEGGCGCGCGSCEDDECESEVIIMRIEKNGDEEYLVPVEDEEELENAFEAFQEQIDEEDDEDDLE
ncbi:MAG TPA: DUF1292 domain-containing protein [Ruminiclostridium sp.]|jgi:uncharacterized protein YrzB (UPF0473 family)|nr:DUF1292 domain-containing protein [Ruminiclostridium sp.]